MDLNGPLKDVGAGLLQLDKPKEAAILQRHDDVDAVRGFLDLEEGNDVWLSVLASCF